MRRNYATQTLDIGQIRANGDERTRTGFYQLSKMQGSLSMESDKANAIYKEFLANKNKLNHGSNVRKLANRMLSCCNSCHTHILTLTEYKAKIEDITDLALVTHKIPDVSDPDKKRKLPPSLHKPTAGLMLQGCAQTGEPLAIVHILTAVYSSSVTSFKAAHDIARMFPKSEIAKYRLTLEELCSKSDTIALGPDALTLKGLFLEMEQQRQKAREAFELAIKRSHLDIKKGSRNPLQLPLITPWNAMGYLLRSDKDPAVQANAKSYFLLGAHKADDPLSCFEASTYEPRTSPDWLKLTSRAAASGHKQATVNLAEFYNEISVKDSPLLNNSGLRKALDWLLSWRKGSAAALLAQEWLQAASKLGHKPSTMQLADRCESMGDHEQAADYLRRIVTPPESASEDEEWPQLVQAAQRRLSGVRVRLP